MNVLIAGTGAIGAATASAFAKAGARLALADIEPSPIAAIASGAFDLLAPEAPSKLAALVSALGDLDVVVYAAGKGWCGDLLDADPDAFHELLEIAVVGLRRVAVATADALARSGGVLVVVSGADARSPDRFLELWGVASACEQALTRCLAAELGPRGVRVMMVDVAGVEGGGLDEIAYLVGEAVGDEETAQRLLAKKRFAAAPRADEVAAAIVGLARAPVHGAKLTLDGGATALGA